MKIVAAISTFAAWILGTAVVPAGSGGAVAQAASVSRISALPACKGQLSLSFDAEDGSFNGMSHSGTLLVVRNLGPAACRIPGLPMLRMKDAAGRVLPFARRAPVGMHPGPVVLPAGLAAGAEATAPLRWVSGDVYDGRDCMTPATVTVSTGDDASTAPWPGGMACGPPAGPIPYDQPPLRADPALP